MSMSDPTNVYAVVPGAGGLPRLDLTAPDGARAAVYLHGAHIASWIPAEGQEQLFMSRRSQFSPGEPIRGGVPVVFPQFGAAGALPLHGLARLLPWDFVEAKLRGDRASATFRLADSEASRRQWAHAFQAELVVSIGGRLMEITLVVTNTGQAPFEFTTSFHTYLNVTDLSAARVDGLAGLRYRDAAGGGVEKLETAERVTFTGEVNRIYFYAPGEARLVEPERTMVIRKTGFSDTVVWNPGSAKCAGMADLEPEDYLRFVCVEAASVGEPVYLVPGKHWEGKQSLEV